MLLSTLRQAPGHLLRRSQQLSWQIFSEEMNGIDLTSVQYAALVAIVEHPGTDATALALLIYFDRATIGGVIERLVGKGLIRRKESKTDRRVKQLYATPAGEALIPAVADRIARVHQRLLEPFTAKQQAVFLSLLRQLIDSQYSVEPGGGEPLVDPKKGKTA